MDLVIFPLPLAIIAFICMLYCLGKFIELMGNLWLIFSEAWKEMEKLNGRKPVK